MASWLSREISDDGKHLPPLKQKSKLPARVTQLSSDSDKSSSSEDEGGKKSSLSKDSAEKLQSQRLSRVPIKVGQEENKIEKDKLPAKNLLTVMGEKPLGRDSGIVLNLIFFSGCNITTMLTSGRILLEFFIPVKCLYCWHHLAIMVCDFGITIRGNIILKK